LASCETNLNREPQAAIISMSGVDCNAYLKSPEILKEDKRVKWCPICLADYSCHVRLWNNGSYQRLCPGEVPGETSLTFIYRKLCPDCRTSFSLHPEPLLKRQRYSLAFVAAWLWAFLKDRVSIRDRSFRDAHQVKLPAQDPLLSWSDSLDQPGQRSRPGYQLLHRWSAVFCLRATQLLPELVNATIEAGQPILSDGWPVATRAQAFLTAWLQWEALYRLEQPTPVIDAQEAFRQLVRTLTKVPSHKARRAVSRRHFYDVLIL